MAGDKRKLYLDRYVDARPSLRVGPWNVSVTALAWGLSAVLHAGLMTTSYFVTWGPVPVSNPEIKFARGDQASRVQILLEPWPDPSDVVDEKAETAEESSHAEPPTTTVHPGLPVYVEEINGLSPAKDVPLEMDAESSVADVEEDEAPVEDDSEMQEEVVAEDDRDAPPVDDVETTTLRAEQVEAIVERVIRRVERFFESVDVKEREGVPPPANSPPPDKAQPVEESVAPPTDERERSEASEAQQAGIETGVEMLKLPAPKYPSLSRKRGEEGVVWLRVEVLVDGSVGEITVLDNAGFDRLTEAAITAARAGRFNPATRDGRPIRATVRIPFRFELR
jgi:TonB family protein